MAVLLWESMKNGLKMTNKIKVYTLYCTLCPDRVTYMSIAASTWAFLVTLLDDPQQNCLHQSPTGVGALMVLRAIHYPVYTR